MAASVVLPALARMVRPAAKAAIHLYLDVASDIRKEVAHHRPNRDKHGCLVSGLLHAGGEELLTQGLEAGAEETLTETVLEGIVGIL